MSEEVTKIINALCEKLGVGATYLIPELAKKSIAQDIAMIIICTAVVIVMALVIKTILNGFDKSDYSNYIDMFDKAFAIAIPVIVLGISFIICAASICDFVGWLASPTAMAIEKITGMIK